MEIGSIVKSVKGRDAERYFIVFEIIDDKFVFLVDGDLRKITNPKKKNITHIKETDKVADNIKLKIEQKRQIFDKEIYKIVKEFNKDN